MVRAASSSPARARAGMPWTHSPCSASCSASTAPAARSPSHISHPLAPLHRMPCRSQTPLHMPLHSRRDPRARTRQHAGLPPLLQPAQRRQGVHRGLRHACRAARQPRSRPRGRLRARAPGTHSNDLCYAGLAGGMRSARALAAQSAGAKGAARACVRVRRQQRQQARGRALCQHRVRRRVAGRQPPHACCAAALQERLPRVQQLDRLLSRVLACAGAAGSERPDSQAPGCRLAAGRPAPMFGTMCTAAMARPTNMRPCSSRAAAVMTGGSAPALAPALAAAADAALARRRPAAPALAAARPPFACRARPALAARGRPPAGRSPPAAVRSCRRRCCQLGQPRSSAGRLLRVGPQPVPARPAWSRCAVCCPEDVIEQAREAAAQAPTSARQGCRPARQRAGCAPRLPADEGLAEIVQLPAPPAAAGPQQVPPSSPAAQRRRQAPRPCSTGPQEAVHQPSRGPRFAPAPSANKATNRATSTLPAQVPSRLVTVVSSRCGP